MAWYGRGGWDYFPPYVSLAEKKAHGAQALAKLLKKSRRAAEPAVVAHRKRKLTTTFWGTAWADNLERYADLANRLPRGRAYLRNGSVLDLTIVKGEVEAYVAGSELYRVTIGIAPLAKMRWRRVVTRCTGRIGSLVGLLRGELSNDVLAVLSDPKDGLFPEPREMRLSCSCPDQAGLCKHLRRSCTASVSGSTRSRSCSSCCVRWTRRSCSARPRTAPCRAHGLSRANASRATVCRPSSESIWTPPRRPAPRSGRGGHVLVPAEEIRRIVRRLDRPGYHPSVSTTMPRQISLAHLTVLDTTPPELVEVAAASGFRTIGIRLTATPSVGVPPYDMLREGPLLRETMLRLSDTGVSVLDTEFLRFEPEHPVGIPEGFLEVSARLGAQNVLVMSAEPEEARPPSPTPDVTASRLWCGRYGERGKRINNNSSKSR